MTDVAGLAKRLGALLLAAALAGCAHQASAPSGAFPEFAPLPPASYGGSAQLEQLLHAAFGAEEATLQCLVDISPQALTVVGVTALGQRVFSIRYDQAGIKAERSAFAPGQVSPERVLSDLQLAYWPLAALEAATDGTAWSVTEPRPGLRRVVHGERLYAEAHSSATGPWPTRLWFVSLAYGYTLDITSAPAAQK